jgi:transglutaminase-like putative cysteine protease
MIKNKLFGIFVLMIFIILQLSGCFEEQTDTEKIKYKSTEIVNLAEKQGKMTFEITIRTNETAEKVRLWVPYPVSNENQKIENMTITGNYDYSGVYREGVYGNMILYSEWNEPKEFPNLNFSFDVWRTEIFLKNFPDKEGEIPIEMQKFLQPTSLAPNSGIVKEVADEVTKGKTTILSKATAIYDYLIEHGQRDPNLNFCGTGDVCQLLLSLRGKCVDFSSVFVALSRTSGVPAKEILGTRISKDGDITGAYHCHAEFYLPNYGWVPVDPSDVAKLMLNDNLDINDSKVVEARNYFFGAQTETYIDLSTGRDVVLNPEQETGALNYFMYPYAEVNGIALDSISQEYLKYIVTFKEYKTR